MTDSQDNLKNALEVPIDTETSPGETDSNKKRVFLGVITGGLLFIGLLIAIIILVVSSGVEYKPAPPKPKPIIISYNPYILQTFHEDSRTSARAILLNNRTAIEYVGSQYNTHTSSDIHIRNTTENFEPVKLMVSFDQLDEHLFNIKYRDVSAERFEVPLFSQGKDPYEFTSSLIKSPLGLMAPMEGQEFFWEFYGKHYDMITMMTTQNCRLQYFDKYIEFEAIVQSNQIFGMGERNSQFGLKTGNYSLWNADRAYEANGDSSVGTHGSHPFFLNRIKHSDKFIGLFMRNTNAMMFSFWNTNNGTYINYKMVGGIIDLYIFHAADPDYIVKKYHNFIGRPYLPPVWAMGFQQARAGYTLAELKDVVSKYRAAYIPIDAVWADVEINDNMKTFTVNSKSYEGIKEFVKYLHDPTGGVDMKFVAMANPGLKAEKGYKFYDMAKKEECFIMSAHTHGKEFQGRTYAGPTVWLDFFMHQSVVVWNYGLADFYDATQFDGIWISHNEPRQDCTGECGYTVDLEKTIPDPFHNESEFDYLQYRPTNDNLETNTLPMASFHHIESWFDKQFYTHNLYGLQTAKVTHEALRAYFEDRRFLLASRSTFPGSGHWGSHWVDQNFASWDSLRMVIPAMLNFNLFGITHIGSPIGGYYGQADKELMLRWYFVGALSPLMLAYGNSALNPKEAYTLAEYVPLVKEAFMMRYELIRFMYTKMFEAYLWGGAVVHSLFFEFPLDENCYHTDVLEKSFMWGKTLYIVPALIKGQTSVKAYMPNWRWYSLETKEIVWEYKDHGIGDWKTYPQNLGQMTILIKGGSIIPYQSLVRASKVANTKDLEIIPVLLIVAPDHTGRAQGTMVTDGNKLYPVPNPESNTYRHYGFTYMNQILRVNKIAGFDFHEFYDFDDFWEVMILDTFDVKEISFACFMDMDLNKRELAFHHSPTTRQLTIRDENMKKIPMSSFESIVWGGPQQHDFCKFEAHISNMHLEDDGKTMIAELSTSDPSAYQLKYDLKARLLTNKIVSLQIMMNEITYENFIVPDIVADDVRKTLKSEHSLTEGGFRTSALGNPFYFEYSTPEDTRDFIFTTKNFPFVFVRNYMHIKFMVNSRHIFGLGERIHGFELKDGFYSVFNHDATSEETGMPPGNNMWGSHAFYLMHLHNPNLFAGVFILNSNPMDFRIRHVGMQTQVDHILIGGALDAFFFQGGSAEEVIQNYHYVIGKPAALPFWGFGYHHCKWGYRGTEHMQIVQQGFENNNIPIDAMWIDKDYMENDHDFTIDRKNWMLLPRFVDLIHGKNLKVVMLIDPAIAIDENYDVYKEGLSRQAFIISSWTNKPLVGVSWPGYSVYMDFVHPGSLEFWEDCLQRFHALVDFDGLWLDMNEPSSFCDGECPDNEHYKFYTYPLDYYDDLYYNPSHRPLEHNTISLESLHVGEHSETEFNYHNLYGLMESRATHRYFSQRLGKRPLVLSSSTFPGSGRYVGHWLGDNWSAWRWMSLSISSVFNFQMFGIPFIGADICGFNGNATIPLCSRWYQLGAFYPMMRNHNSMFSTPQEPYIDEKLASVAKKAIRTRYALSRYIYTLHMKTVLHGGLYFSPLLFQFPSDLHTYKQLDEVFMVGHALRVTPVLADKVTVLESYFPNHNWFDFYTLKQVMEYNVTKKHGENLTLTCSLDSENTNIHIRGGSIFTVHPKDYSDSAIRITQMLNYPVDLIVAPHEHTAMGHVIYDDDENFEYRNGNYHEYEVKYDSNKLTVHLLSGNAAWSYKHRDNIINTIKVLGIHEPEKYQCVKLHNKTSNMEVLLHAEANSADRILTLKANSGELGFQHIDNIIWTNSTC